MHAITVVVCLCIAKTSNAVHFRFLLIWKTSLTLPPPSTFFFVSSCPNFGDPPPPSLWSRKKNWSYRETQLDWESAWGKSCSELKARTSQTRLLREKSKSSGFRKFCRSQGRCDNCTTTAGLVTSRIRPKYWSLEGSSLDVCRNSAVGALRSARWENDSLGVFHTQESYCQDYVLPTHHPPVTTSSPGPRLPSYPPLVH